MEGTGELPGDNSNEPAAPLYFGNYEVLKSIGKGKFAVVYRAKKIGDDQVIALKRIAVDMMNDKAKEKCLKEVRLLQNLDHPNIIRYMDSFLTDNDLFIAYEWAAAGDLKRQLRKAQERGTGFEERVIWKYFSQISNAVKYMHDKRIMHRDLKPANIFLTLDGTIKVGDLGLSRELSEHTIQAHSKVGTPLYMSPEVLNKGEGYDFKSDIWSLGCLLYELAMLKSPFKAEGLNLYSLFQKISNGDYPRMPENAFSEELRNLTYAMLSTQPEDRPEMSEVARIAQEMRTFTANDKSSKSKIKKATTGGVNSVNSGEGSSRPNSGAAAANNNNITNNNSNNVSNAPLHADAKHVESHRDAPRADSAGSSRPSSTRTGALQREGSFRLEYVNGGETDTIEPDEDKDYDNRGSDSKPSSRPTSHTRNSYNQRSQQQQRGGRHPEPEPEPDDAEDEVTVGLGQGDFLLDRQEKALLNERSAGVTGIVELGSDRAYTGNNSKTTNNNNDKSNDRSNASNQRAYGSSGGKTVNGRNTYVNNVQNDSDIPAKGSERNEEVRPTFDPTEYRASAPRDYHNTSHAAVPTNNTNNSDYNAASTKSKFDKSDKSPVCSPNTMVTNNNTKPNPSSSNMYYNANHSSHDKKNIIKSGAVAPLPSDPSSSPFHRTDNDFNSTNNTTISTMNTTNHISNTTFRTNTLNATSTTTSTKNNKRTTTNTFSETTSLPFTDTFKPTAVGLKLEEHLEPASVAFAIMSNVYDKLLLLNCPLSDPNIKEVSRETLSRGRLLPFHFACDLQLYPAVAGHNPGYRFMQFQRFAYIALWLISAVSTTLAADVAKSVDIHSDTPVMLAKQILRLTQSALGGTLTTDLNNITPTSLTVGYGVNVCTVLSLLADAALAAMHFEVHGTVQLSMNKTCGTGFSAEIVQEGEEEEMEDEALMLGSDDEQAPTTANHSSEGEEDRSENSFAEYSSSVGKEKGLGMSVILGTIDPAQWKLETDRVAVKLSAAARHSRAGGGIGIEWADHVEALKGYTQLNASKSNNSNGVTKDTTANSSVAAEVTTELAAQLQYTVRSLESALAKIKQSEGLLNKNDAVSSGALAYSTHKSELTEKEARISILQTTLSASTQRLTELQERCDEVNEILNTKTGNEPGSSGGDYSSAGGAVIVRLKDGLKTMKQEIKEMTMGIMLLNQNLLAERVQQVKGRRTPNQRRAQRQKASKDSILSDDELLD